MVITFWERCTMVQKWDELGGGMSSTGSPGISFEMIFSCTKIHIYSYIIKYLRFVMFSEVV